MLIGRIKGHTAGEIESGRFKKLSEYLWEQIRKNPALEIEGPPEPMEFGAAGNLGGLNVDQPTISVR